MDWGSRGGSDRHTVGRDLAAAHVASHRTHETGCPGLFRGVHLQAGFTDTARVGNEGDQAAALALDHVRDHSARAVDDAVQVHIHGTAPDLRPEFPEWLAAVR